MEDLVQFQLHKFQLWQQHVTLFTWKPKQNFVVDMIPVAISVRGRRSDFWAGGRILRRHNGSLRSEKLSDFCKGPSPRGRRRDARRDSFRIRLCEPVYLN